MTTIVTLDTGTCTGWTMLCNGDATKRDGHWSLFAKRRIKRWRVKWEYYPDQDQSLGHGFLILGDANSAIEQRHTKLLRCLLELDQFCRVDFCFWEKKIPGSGQFADEIGSKLVGAAETFTIEKKLRRLSGPIPNLDWARHFIGAAEHRHAKRVARETGEKARDRLKSLSRARAAAYGIAVERDDESDALGVMDYVLAHRVHLPAPWRAGEVQQQTLRMDGLLDLAGAGQ